MTAQAKILIIEDNDLNLKLLKDFLEYNNYVICASSEGKAAIEIARQQHPDLILLDMQLPDISGFEVLHRLKQNAETSDIPIIAVTAFAMQGDRANILASGCNDYLSKPFKITELLQLVQRYTTPGDDAPDSDRVHPRFRA